MPLAALLPLMAALLGLCSTAIALGFARAPGWEPYRSAAWPALFASVYCIGDVLITFPSIANFAWLVAAAQVMGAGGYSASLGWYLPAATGPNRLDHAMRWFGVSIALLGVVSLVPGIVLERIATYREIAWLGSSYTEAYPTPFGQVIQGAALLGLSLPFARTIGDLRRGHRSAWLHIVGFSALILTGLADVVTTQTQLRMPYVLSLGFMITIACFGLAVFARFAGHAAELDKRTRLLGDLIDERTDELASAKDQLHRAEKLAALGQLAAGVAHEVNNPAAAVVANLSYMLEAHTRAGEFPADSAQAVQESLTAMGRVTRIVRQLLDAGRAGARHEVLEPVELARAVDGALSIVRALVPANVTVRSTIEAELTVKGREDLLVQALVNLVTNAVQAIPAGDAGLVTISAISSGRRVTLVVEDDGIGMSDEVRDRIFEPFFTTKASGVGTGLGLSVTLGIIRSLGGEVSVESRSGVGTRMSVNLRAGRTTARSPVEDRRPSVAPAKKLCVLIVDDERAVREALRRVLKRTYDIRLAGGVDEALEELKARPDVDVILCDVLMPDGGGERVYRVLQQGSPELARRLVFVTGGAPDGTRAFLESQPQPVLEKPLDAQQLAATIARLLGEGESTSPGVAQSTLS